MCISSAYDAMLNGTPRKMSALRWYSWHDSRPSRDVELEQRVARRAAPSSSSSPTFQALTMMRREFGSLRIRSSAR